MMRAGKEAELLALERRGMTVSVYEGKFISLSNLTDNIFHTKERKAQMFEKGLQL